MAGYNGFSMSNNAVQAYDDGLLTASKIGRGIPASLVTEHCFYEEWHHTSGAFNRTRFYNQARVLATFGLIDHDEYPAKPEAVAALAAHKEAKTAASTTTYHNCRVRWLEWLTGIYSKRPRADERVEHGCTVAVNGQTATITFRNGTTMVKRLSTRGFGFEADQPVPPKPVKEPAAECLSIANRMVINAKIETARRDVHAARIAGEATISAIPTVKVVEFVTESGHRDALAAWARDGFTHPCPEDVMIAKRAVEEKFGAGWSVIERTARALFQLVTQGA